MQANADRRSTPLFSGNRAWLDGFRSLDSAGANLVDGDRLTPIAENNLGDRFDSTELRGLANSTGHTLEVNPSPGRMHLALAMSVTAMPEPSTPLLAAWMRRLRPSKTKHRRDPARTEEHRKFKRSFFSQRPPGDALEHLLMRSLHSVAAC